jgi:hypothetical protein
LQK